MTLPRATKITPTLGWTLPPKPPKKGPRVKHRARKALNPAWLKLQRELEKQ